VRGHGSLASAVGVDCEDEEILAFARDRPRPERHRSLPGPPLHRCRRKREVAEPRWPACSADIAHLA